MIAEAEGYRWEALVEGLSYSIEFQISAESMRSFAEVSGDRSPLHKDDEFARGRGFKSRIVYGGLILAQASRLLGMHLPGSRGLWTGVSMDFRAPLYVGERAVMEGRITQRSEAARALVIRLTVRTSDRLVATGVAHAVVHAHG